MATPLRTLGLCLALLGSGCTSTWYSMQFVPSPVEVSVSAPGEPYGAARVLLAVRGVRRAKDAQPAQVEINLRLENVGADPMRLGVLGFDLVTSDLISFCEPGVDPPPGEILGPGEKRNYLLSFATPEDRDVDELDWSGLNISFKLHFGEREVLTGVTFDRLFLPGVPAGYYYDPYWGPYPYGPYRPYTGSSRVRVGVGASVSN